MKSDQFSDVTRVVSDDMKFKAKLAIGENAYASLRNANAVRKYWDLFGAVGGGAAVAQSSVVATTFFAPQGLLGLIGLGTAATPVGWIVAAAVLSGGAWYGVMRTLNGATDSRVTVIPKFVNTPIDVLGTALFDLMMPLALKVAVADGRISDDERVCIRDYFIKEWGFDGYFVDAGFKLIEAKLDEFKISEVAEQLIEYKKTNPDCNYSVMSDDLLVFLREVIEADGEIDEREEQALREVKLIFDGASHGYINDSLVDFGSVIAENFKKGTRAVATGAEAFGSAALAGAEAVSRSQAFDRIKDGAEKGAANASDVLRAGFEKTSQITGDLLNKFKQ